MDTQRQWKADVDQLKETASSDTMEAARNERVLQEANIQLDAESARLRNTNKELKEAYGKTRDLLRLEQIALEGARAELASLTDELLASRDETVRMKQLEEEMSELQRTEMEALVISMDELDQRRIKDVSRVKEELSRQYLLQSSLQQEILQLRGAMEKERCVVQRDGGLLRLVSSLDRWRRNRLSTMFRQWCVTSGLMSAAQQFRDKLRRSLSSAAEEARVDRDRALDSQRDILQKDHEVVFTSCRRLPLLVTYFFVICRNTSQL